MPDTFDVIKETAMDFQPLFQRMDRDKDLYNMIEYQLLDLKTKKPAKDVVNMTLNDPKVFADRSMAFMSEASMQTIAEGRRLQDSETATVENFDADIRYNIDQSLMMRDITGLYNFLIEQACIRGTLGARYYSWDDGGTFKPDLLPCDSRFLIYEHGRDELEFAAFRTTRTKSSIQREYPDAIIQGTGKKGAIWEHWNTKINEIWLTDPVIQDATKGQMLLEKENKFGYVPFIIQGVGAGSMLQDEDSMAHRYESIFASNRLLYEHLNMLGSILQTLNYMTFNRAYQWESESGTLANNPPAPDTRDVIPVDKGTRGLFPIEINDVNNSTRLFYSLILGALQRGSLPNIDYGNLTFPLSAVAISKLTSSKDAIFTPRLQAIAWFYRKLHYMMKDQYIKGGYQAELGEEGMERKYTVADLDKDYKISYKFHSVSPEQDIANYAVAQQAQAVGMSQHTVFTDIIKLQDPNGEIMKARAERVEKVDPVIGLFRYGLSLIDQGTEEGFMEADLVKDSIKRLLRQRYAQPDPGEEAQMADGMTNKGVSGQSMLPLLGGGGGGGGGQPPEPEQMLNQETRRTEAPRKLGAEG
uniref:Portal protein n=1 Tax=viral metagenome TaxID=1070528 RepID=A0A6H1ZKA0_9ZZZZ